MERMPKNVAKALEMLENSGFEAYVVGGCVRDSIMGREISDWIFVLLHFPMRCKECLKTKKQCQQA